MVVLSIQNYIGGNFQAPIVDDNDNNNDNDDGGTSRRSLPVTNPATGEVLATVCVSSTGDVDAAVHARLAEANGHAHVHGLGRRRGQNGQEGRGGQGKTGQQSIHGVVNVALGGLVVLPAAV